METTSQGFFSRHLGAYPPRHTTRRNLVIHALTNPLFLWGNVTLVASPFTAWWLAPVGMVAMVVAMALQGRGHTIEPTPPEAFGGPLDVARRIFAEQWITFPRYVFNGGFARAWKASAP